MSELRNRALSGCYDIISYIHNKYYLLVSSGQSAVSFTVWGGMGSLKAFGMNANKPTS
jgi:hypothetical protein